VFALCQSIFVSQSKCRCAYRSPARILHPAVEPGHRVRWSVSLAVLCCSLSLFLLRCFVVLCLCFPARRWLRGGSEFHGQRAWCRFGFSTWLLSRSLLASIRFTQCESCRQAVFLPLVPWPGFHFRNRVHRLHSPLPARSGPIGLLRVACLFFAHGCICPARVSCSHRSIVDYSRFPLPLYFPGWIFAAEAVVPFGFLDLRESLPASSLATGSWFCSVLTWFLSLGFKVPAAEFVCSFFLQVAPVLFLTYQIKTQVFLVLITVIWWFLEHTYNLFGEILYELELMFDLIFIVIVSYMFLLTSIHTFAVIRSFLIRLRGLMACL
jgi:hypothetical protein